MTRNLLAASCLIAGIAALGIPESADTKTLPTIIPGQWHGPPLGRPIPGLPGASPEQPPEITPGHPMPRVVQPRRYHRRSHRVEPIRQYPLHGGRVLPGSEHQIPRVSPSPEHKIPRVLPR